MIIFAGFIPNSPLLLPAFARGHENDVKKTTLAIQAVAEELTVLKPDVVVIVGEITGQYDHHFFVEFADPYKATFKELGDLETEDHYSPSFAFTDKLQRLARERATGLSLETSDHLPFTLGVPLRLLFSHATFPIAPLSPAEGESLKNHYTLGQLVRDTAHETGLRVAMVAVGHSSHTMSDLSPSGFNAAGAELTATLLDIITTKNAAGLQQLADDVRTNAQETCVRELAVLFGALEGTSQPLVVHSEEAPLGVSFIVASASVS